MASQALTYDMPDCYSETLQYITEIAASALNSIRNALSSIAESILAALEFLKENILAIYAGISFIFYDFARTFTFPSCIAVPDAEALYGSERRQLVRHRQLHDDAPKRIRGLDAIQLFETQLLEELHVEIGYKTDELQQLTSKVDMLQSKTEHLDGLASMKTEQAQALITGIAGGVNSHLQVQHEKKTRHHQVRKAAVRIGLFLFGVLVEILLERLIELAPIFAFLFAN
ncbi:MAG TPA: hypothetical protein VGE04_07370 [Chloroflexia bacterium]|jgi:hypothetical protein